MLQAQEMIAPIPGDNPMTNKTVMSISKFFPWLRFVTSIGSISTAALAVRIVVNAAINMNSSHRTTLLFDLWRHMNETHETQIIRPRTRPAIPDIAMISPIFI